MPSGKDKGKNREAKLHMLRTPLRRIVGKGRLKPPPPLPRGRKRAASEDLEAETPKKGKKVSPGGSAVTGTLTASCPPMGQPSTEL